MRRVGGGGIESGVGIEGGGGGGKAMQMRERLGRGIETGDTGVEGEERGIQTGDAGVDG